jgi:predicted alpha/beta-hydrolase family hydrolase
MSPLRVVLGPPALGSPASLRRHVEGLRARGVEARAIALPRGRAETAVPTFQALSGPDVVAGGHSFGGRVASLAAVEATFAGLLLFAYPLAGRGEERTRHLASLRCPTLVLQGEADELSPIGEVRRLIAAAPLVRLVTFPGADHQLHGALERALDEAAAFLHGLEAVRSDSG